MCALADQSPWEGVQCQGIVGGNEECQYGLEKILKDPKDPSIGGICCQKSLGSTYDDCKCLPCLDMKPCDTTQTAQENAYHDYKRLGFSDADATAASQTYICAWNAWWDKSGGFGKKTEEKKSQEEEKKPQSEEVKPIFKCCQSLEGDHKCKCPPAEDPTITKRCYSKWSNRDLIDCRFGLAWHGDDWGKLCCVNEQTGKCKGVTVDGDLTNVEGFEDWAKCDGAAKDSCLEKAQYTREAYGYHQTSGCVWDVMPMQKYCGREVESEKQCQDQRPLSYQNNCGLSAMSDTEWFVNGTDQVQFAAIQAIKLSNAYCGEWWIDHPVTGKKSALLV
jgi:hypothetical protein